MAASKEDARTDALRRELGTFAAVLMGLGAMIGSGVFVSLGFGAGLAGPAVILALAVAAALALCNGLSSAQLAAAHPVSGGTYEYGYRYLSAWAGFTAGWVFLIAKSASAATAALGFAAYLLQMLGYGPRYMVPTAVAVLGAVLLVVLAGIRRSHLMNALIVGITVSSLLFFVWVGLPAVRAEHMTPFFSPPGGRGRPTVITFLEATALMFVAYTGYARIATLGEEIRDPARSIPRAIVTSALLVMLLYAAVAFVAIGAQGSGRLAAATAQGAAPLAVVAESFAVPFAGKILAVGALTAMLGVLLNLILGLSRVVLAMARRGDLPHGLARLDAQGTTPYFAVVAVSLLVAALVALGDVRATWSYSAFAVLIYYSLTHLAALSQPPPERRYPRWIAAVGLLACTSLAFFIEPKIWQAGLAAILVGLSWHAYVRRLAVPALRR